MVCVAFPICSSSCQLLHGCQPTFFNWISADLKPNKDWKRWHLVQENRCRKRNAWLFFLLCSTFSLGSLWGHFMIFFSHCLLNYCTNSSNFSSINSIRQMESLHLLSKSCWVRLMFSYFSLTHTDTFCHFSRVLCVCVCVFSEAATLNWRSCENSATEIRSLSIIITPLSPRKQILAR